MKDKNINKKKKDNIPWTYSEQVKDHFFNPRNFMSEEDIKHYKYDGKGTAGSPVCGDVMEMWIRVKDNKIIECKWRTFGCASAIASTSVLSEMVKGMNVDEAYKITPKDILERLEGLPPNKVHCSVLGDQALRKAIDDWREKRD